MLAPGLLDPDLPELRIAAELALAGTIAQPEATLTFGAQIRTPDGWINVDADASVVNEVGTVRVIANQQLMRRAEVTGGE